MAGRQWAVHHVIRLTTALFLEGRWCLFLIKAGLLTLFRLQTPSHRFPASWLLAVCKRKAQVQQRLRQWIHCLKDLKELTAAGQLGILTLIPFSSRLSEP